MQGVSASPGGRFPEPIEQSLEPGHALAKLGELFPVFLDVAAEPSKQRGVQNREGGPGPGSDDGVGIGERWTNLYPRKAQYNVQSCPTRQARSAGAGIIGAKSGATPSSPAGRPPTGVRYEALVHVAPGTDPAFGTIPPKAPSSRGARIP